MADFLGSSAAQLVLWLVVLGVAVALSVYYVRKWRDDDENDVPQTGELLANFRDLHAQGILSSEEYRTIKAKLAQWPPSELSNREQPG